MDSLTVDNTYGRALYDAAKEREKVDEIGEEFRAVSKVFKDNPLLKKLFLIPTVSAPDKRDVAKKVFEDRISQELLNFIYILIDRRRVGAWKEIGLFYEHLVLENDGKTKGVVYSALPLDEKRKKALEVKTEAAIGKKVRLENRIDKSLIGGLRIYVDGKLIDASVKTRLENMKQRIIR
jgi:ATP synthase F1 delta subunit